MKTKKILTKALSVFLVVVMTLTAAPLSGFVGLELPKWMDTSIKAQAAMSDDIISIARDQKGSYGSDINKFTTWYYGKQTNAAWCAIFVSWCANQAGVLKDAIPKKANCASMMEWFKNRGEYYSVSSDYVPQKGDIIFFDTDGSGVTHHVEFVAQSGYITENGKTKVKCIGGNTSNSSFNGSDYVAEKNRYIYQSSCKVMGYAHPSYGDVTDYSNYTYSFNFNANGGTLGSTGAFSVSYGEQFQVLNTTCTRSGYTWAGWNVKRNNDNKWYVDGQGWCTESQISNNGYIKKSYPNYKTLTLDDSWTSGISGDCSYTFYAIWIQQRETHIKIFMSPYGEGYDHITAMNNATDIGFTQEQIYAWYVIYDSYTGELLNSYADTSYSVTFEVYDPDGELIDDPYTYDNADANWIGFSPQQSGTYVVEATFIGDLTSGEPATVTATYDVSYDAELISSASSVSLNLNGTNSQTITIDVGGSYPGEKDATVYTTSGYYSMDECYWSNGKIYITLRGLKTGDTSVKVELYEKYTGNKNVVATIIIPVTITANSYTISYDANGGSGAPSSQTKYYGTDITLSSTIPIRSGYTFLGWSTSSTATSATYQPGDTYSVNSGLTLYAVWGQNTYTLTYDANGGTGAPPSQSSSGSFKVSSVLPTRWGYNFAGWNMSATSPGVQLRPGDTFSSKDTTLYAVWRSSESLSENTTYSEDNSAYLYMANQELFYKYIPASSGTYVIYSIGDEDTRVYLYNSSGAELANNDDGGEGNNFRLQYDLTAGTTYYFKVKYYNSSKTGNIPFVFGKVYSVTYNANGGSGAPSSQSKDYGTDITLSGTAPTRTGYTFLGWATSSTATSVTYQPGDTFTTDANTTLYAVWKANTYSVKYNANGGSGTMSNSSHTYGSSKALTSNTFTRSGYTFLGWSTSSSATVTTYTDGQSVKNLTATNGETVNLYAVWQENETYTITYDSNGAGGIIMPADQTKTHGEALTLSIVGLERTGYTFLGWATSSAATSASYQPGDTFTTDANTTLYAVWKANTYTVTFYTVGGTCSTNSKTVTYDSTYGTLPNPTKNGCVFDGWYTDSTGGTKITSSTKVTITANQELYAQWKGNTYSVTFDSCGGTCSTSSTNVVYDSFYGELPVPTRTGYSFDGWYTAIGGQGGTHVSSSSMVYIAENHTLYAHWTPIKYTVSYDANGGTGTMSNSSHTYNSSKALTTNSFTRSGYIFLGWSSSFSATTATYTNGQSVENLTSTDGETVTLYAVWQIVEPEVVLGDVNGDDVIDAGDAVIISRYDAGLITLTPEQLAAADINKDGYVDAGDAVIISRYDAGLITTLKNEEEE